MKSLNVWVKTWVKAGFAILAVLMTNNFPLMVAQAETIMIPAGTRISVMVPNNISSNSVKTSDSINLTIAQDVLVQNKVVFHQGDAASINVHKAQSSGAWGRPGLLELDSAMVTDVTGNKIPTNISYTAKGASRRAFSIAGVIISVPLVLFAVGLITLPIAVMTSGKESRIGQGTVLDTVTTAPTEIEL